VWLLYIAVYFLLAGISLMLVGAALANPDKEIRILHYLVVAVMWAITIYGTAFRS
jgi:hypothetical protein